MKGGGFKVKSSSRCYSAIRKTQPQKNNNELIILDLYQNTNTLNQFLTPRNKNLVIRKVRPQTGQTNRNLIQEESQPNNIFGKLRTQYQTFRLTDKSKQNTKCQLETIVDSMLKKTNTTIDQDDPKQVIQFPKENNVYNLLQKSSTSKIKYKYIQIRIKRSSSQGLVNNQNVQNTPEIKADPTLHLERYLIISTLGTGSYAVVKLARDKLTEKLVAIKTYQKQKLYNHQRKQSLKREIHILKILDHPNIINLINTIESSSEFHLIVEYGGAQSLRSYLKQFPNRKLEEDEAKFIFKQVVKAVEYCHQQDIVHRDIKLENILLKDNNQVKLIDFGFSVIVNKEAKLSVFCGTPSYMAPELVNKSDYYGKPVDTWALGVLLYVLLCGAFPFRGKDDSELFSNIKKGIYKSPSVSTACLKLLSQMLTIRPSERITVNRILCDRWLNS